MMVDKAPDTEDLNSRSVDSVPTHSSSSQSRNFGDYESIGGPVSYNNFPKDPKFAAIVREVELSIEHGIQPILSAKGTSGCYFVQDREQVQEVVVLCLRFRHFSCKLV